MTRIIAGLLFAASVLVATSSGSIVPEPAPVPDPWPVHVPICPEDAVAVGHGQYHSGFGWDDYQCIALDDLSEE